MHKILEEAIVLKRLAALMGKVKKHAMIIQFARAKKDLFKNPILTIVAKITVQIVLMVTSVCKRFILSLFNFYM